MEKHQLFSLKKTEEKQIIANYEVLFIFSTDRNRSLLGNKFVFAKQIIHNEDLSKDCETSLSRN